MRRPTWRTFIGLLLAAGCVAQTANPQRALTWQETQDEFRRNNPTLLAGQETIAEARADEITANLRPNPTLNLGWDQITPFAANPYRPIWQSYIYGSADYLHEREHKRELRLEVAKEGTAIATSAQADLERNLMFNLRDAFVRVLESKAILRETEQNLAYYDKEIDINRTRFQAGDLAKVDFERIELQRVQFESDVATARVNLRTAKIDLLALLGDKTPVDDFDVQAPFDFAEPSLTLQQLREEAARNRPDVREARQSLEQARSSHKLAIANGSSDPIFGIDGSHQPPPLNTYIGFSVSFPLRIFDRNQGDKLHTLIDITRNQKLFDAAEVAALHDVDSAYATLQSTLTLLRPYKSRYLEEAENVRATMSYSYEHGAASLLDFLNAQQEYRNTEINYLNLVGAYLSAANQVNFAVGREVIQ